MRGIYFDMRKLNILLFCNRPKYAKDANTIVEHIDSFFQYSKHNIIVHSERAYFPPSFDLNLVDVIVIHYSMYLLNNAYLTKETKERIQAFKGLKVLFLQDEYRQVNKIHDMLNYLGVDVLFTCIPDQEMDKIYPKSKLPTLTKINTLTGYTSEFLLKQSVPAIKDRPLDVGYRARKLPFWYGQLAVEKWKIADDFYEYTKGESLKLDLSYAESKRIYGDKWLEFVTNCKTMLGVESGASVIDFTGELEKKIEEFQAKHPTVSFDEVQEKFLKNIDGKIYMNQISPRCFEAIALKTALILFEGEYSGILIPGCHYISLKKDFSNISDVVSKIKDDNYLQNMVDTAYAEIAMNHSYSYQYFVNRFDLLIEQEFQNNPSKYRQVNKLSASERKILKQAIKKQKIPIGFSISNLKAKGKQMMLSRLIRIYAYLPDKLQLVAKPRVKSLFKKLGLL